MSALLSEQVADILGLHICRCLQPADLQALQQTCTTLHKLVAEGLPAATWAAVAANALPAAHPLLALPGAQVKSRLQQIARAKWILPTPECKGIWEGKASEFITPSAVNHKGDQIIMRKGDTITVCQLTVDDSHILLSPVFTQSPVESVDEEQVDLSEVTITWSPDDCYAAIHFNIRDYDDPRSDFDEDGVFEVVHLYDSRSLKLQEVTYTQDAAVMVYCLFSPSGQMLLICWELFGELGIRTLIETYDTTTLQRTARLHPTDLQPFRWNLAFSPNGQQLAVATADGFNAIDAAGSALCKSSRLRHFNPARSSTRIKQVAFFPDGVQLGTYKEGDSGAILQVFDTESGECKRSLQASHAPGATESEAAYFVPRQLLISFTSIVAVNSGGLRIFSIKPERFGRQLLAVNGSFADAHDMVAVSPDGIFLSAIIKSCSQDAVSYRLHVFEMATGRQLHTYAAQGWSTDAGNTQSCNFALSWASSGLRLFVRCQRLLYGAESGDDMAEGLLVFTF